MGQRKFTPKMEAFCQAFMATRCQTKAAVQAGYSPRSAPQQGYTLMKDDRVKKRIQELEAEYAAKMDVSAEDIIKRYTQIAFANVNELISLRRVPCRHCHGKGHKYQWRHKAEFEAEVEQYEALSDSYKLKKKKPAADGGYGYRTDGEPHPDCPNCDGRGIASVEMRDTAYNSQTAMALFAGVKQTQHGIEIKMNDQMHALDQLARIRGVFDVERKPGDNLTDALGELVRSINQRGSPPAFGDDRLEQDDTGADDAS